LSGGIIQGIKGKGRGAGRRRFGGEPLNHEGLWGEEGKKKISEGQMWSWKKDGRD